MDKRSPNLAMQRKKPIAESIMVAVNEVNPSINDEDPPDSPMPKEHHGMSTRRIMKNLNVMNLGYFLYFAGFWSLSNLQSTMNASKGLGPESQAVIYAVSMVSSLLLPDLVVKRFGCKWTFVLTTMLSLPYIAANADVAWETLMPASVLYGLAAGPLNTAQSLYVDELAVRYSKLTFETLEAAQALFFGIFMFFSENTQVWGNLVSYLVLDYGDVHVDVNHSRACGIEFRQWDGQGNDTNPNLNPPSDEKRYILVGVFVLCGLLSLVLMSFFMDNLNNDKEDINSADKCATVGRRFMSALNMLRNPKHFGVSGATTAILVGPLVKYVGQTSVILFAATIDVVICVLLFTWHPSPDVTIPYFVLAGVWGMSDAIWWSQIPALLGLMFPNDREAAYSNFFFWSFLGFFMCYSYANYLTIPIKINILLIMLICGAAGFIAIKVKDRCSTQVQYVAIAEC